MAGRSSLNPRATSYVPFSKRDAEKDSKNHHHDDEASPQPHHHHHILESKTKIMSESLQQLKTTNNPSSPPQPQDVTELIEEDADMDIEFLKMIFPDFAEQSLRDVYFVSYADLNGAIDMLNHLEYNCEDESSKTLDNGNVSESAPAAADSASPKLNNTAAAKASASSNPKELANK